MDKATGKLLLILYILALMLPIVYAAEETTKQKEETRSDIAALDWQGSKLKLVLYDPNGIMIPGINNSTIKHVVGPNFEYYILNNTQFGKWTLDVVPVDLPKEGENFAIFTGPVKGYQKAKTLK